MLELLDLLAHITVDQAAFVGIALVQVALAHVSRSLARLRASGDALWRLLPRPRLSVAQPRDVSGIAGHEADALLHAAGDILRKVQLGEQPADILVHGIEPG